MAKSLTEPQLSRQMHQSVISNCRQKALVGWLISPKRASPGQTAPPAPPVPAAKPCLFVLSCFAEAGAYGLVKTCIHNSRAPVIWLGVKSAASWATQAYFVGNCSVPFCLCMATLPGAQVSYLTSSTTPSSNSLPGWLQALDTIPLKLFSIMYVFWRLSIPQAPA